MIAAVEEQRRQERTRSAANVSGVGMPSFSAVMDMLSTAQFPGGANVCVASTPSVGTASTAASTAPSAGGASVDVNRYLGQSVGSGQCVALVRAAHPDLGPSATWSAGASVQGNTALQPGTPIATFSGNRYANALDGSSHAAIYLGQDASGVKVLDQWAGSAAAVRTIPWQNASGVPANTGSAFRVVQPG